LFGPRGIDFGPGNAPELIFWRAPGKPALDAERKGGPMTVKDFSAHNYRHFQRGPSRLGLLRRLTQAFGWRGKMLDAGRSDEQGGAGAVARGTYPAGQGARDLARPARISTKILLTSSRTIIRARARTIAIERRRRSGAAARARHEPGDRHVHSEERGPAPRTNGT